jgi:hypothetical protein
MIPIISVLPTVTVNLYDVPPFKTILEYQQGSLKIVHTGLETRHAIKLTQINKDSLIGIIEALDKLEKLSVWDKSCILCICDNQVGLMCIDSNLTDEKLKDFESNDSSINISAMKLLEEIAKLSLADTDNEDESNNVVQAKNSIVHVRDFLEKVEWNKLSNIDKIKKTNI